MLKKIVKFVKNPKLLLLRLDNAGLIPKLKDETYLKILFKQRIGQDLNLKNPQTFNEKLQWLKLHDRSPRYTKLVDKYEVKEVVSKTIGEEYIIPTIGVWDKFEDIDFDTLPNQFVLKCTHDSGGLVSCKDKSNLDIKSARKKLSSSLKRNYYYSGREWPYKNVKPRIIAEQFMSDPKNEDLVDYKFMCYNGKVKYVFTCTERRSAGGLKVTFFDTDWNKLPFERHYKSSSVEIPKPINFSKMIELAEILSKDIPFVRIDFYEIDDKIYFGEYTFYPGSGMEEFSSHEWDLKLGKEIDLRLVKNESE